MKSMMTVVLAMVLVGCATTGNRQIMNAGFMDSLKVGVTSKDEVKALLGEPQHHGQQTGGSSWEVWRYAGMEKSVNAACFIPLVDLAAGRQTIQSRVVDIYFDQQGIITDVKVESDMSERMMPVGTLMLGAAAVGAAAGVAASRPYGYGYGYGGKAVINTIPTAGGGSISTIKWYR